VKDAGGLVWAYLDRRTRFPRYLHGPAGRAAHIIMAIVNCNFVRVVEGWWHSHLTIHHAGG
jgi:hypothetical protein